MLQRLATICVLLVLVHATSNAQPPLTPEMQRLIDEAHRILDLQRLVENSPDDRVLYKQLLRAGFDSLQNDRAARSIPEDSREDILTLKLVMEDMMSIQAAIADMNPPWWAQPGIDAARLVSRLESSKVPLGYRRSVPLVDPWGTPYRLVVDAELARYKIVCAGSDGTFEDTNLVMSGEDLDPHFHEPHKNSSLADDIVFFEGHNFTRILDYPDAQTFLSIRCEPADEPELGRVRCW
jgi:hypothetical protein